jgi:hypothetical protein
LARCTDSCFRDFPPVYSCCSDGNPNADKLGLKTGTVTQHKARRTNQMVFFSLRGAQEVPSSNLGAPTIQSEHPIFALFGPQTDGGSR